MKKSLVLSTVAVLAAAPAFAADIVPAPPVTPIAPIEPIQPAADWSGVYVGVNGGYAWGNFDAGVDETCPPASAGGCKLGGTGLNPGLIPATMFDLNGNGWVGGAQMGVNQQVGALVFGVEGDIQVSNVHADAGVIVDANTAAKFAGTPTVGDGLYEVGVSVDIPWFATLRGRAGVAADRVLFYGTAGAAYAQIDAQVSAGDISDSFGSGQWGWVAGAGAEVMVTEQLSLKTEYLYSDFGSFSYDYVSGVDELSGDVDASLHTVRAGLNFHF